MSRLAFGIAAAPRDGTVRLGAAVESLAYEGLWAAYSEIVPALWRQRKDPTWFVKRQLPRGAAATPVTSGIAVPAE